MAVMDDARARRIADDTHLIFMARAVQRYYGDDGLDALLEHKRKRVLEQWKDRARESGRDDPAYLECLFSPHAHEFEVLERSPTRLEVKVSRCVHAEVFKSYCASDLGERLICAGDHAVVEGFSPSIHLDRPSTCMSGQCCHFIFYKDASIPPST